MEHDVPAHIYLLGIAIPAIATVFVAFVTTSRGKKRAEAEEPFKPQESGEHAHTREVIHMEAQRIWDRIDLSDTARGLARQSEQVGVSTDRLAERKGKK